MKNRFEILYFRTCAESSHVDFHQHDLYELVYYPRGSGYMTIDGERFKYNKNTLFDEFIKPYYEKLLPHLKKYGIITFVDTDGNIHELVEWFDELGLDGLLPNERQAGVDVKKIREKYPHMRFIGGFDKMIMSKGEEAMRNEFERLLPVASQGGYIISCDHQTPPEVSYEDYKLFLRLLEEYSQRAANNDAVNVIS